MVKTFAGEGRGISGSCAPILTDTEYQQLTAARAKQLGKNSSSSPHIVGCQILPSTVPVNQCCGRALFNIQLRLIKEDKNSIRKIRKSYDFWIGFFPWRDFSKFGIFIFLDIQGFDLDPGLESPILVSVGLWGDTFHQSAEKFNTSCWFSVIKIFLLLYRERKPFSMC